MNADVMLHNLPLACVQGVDVSAATCKSRCIVLHLQLFDHVGCCCTKQLFTFVQVAAQYNTWLLVKLMPKGVLYSFLFLFLFQVSELAEKAADRSTRVAACEFLHAVTLWMIGMHTISKQLTVLMLLPVLLCALPSATKLAECDVLLPMQLLSVHI